MAALQSNAPFGKLFIVGKDGDKDLEFLIDKPSITIGRDKSCDIVIVRREISRKHAQLAVDDDGMVWLSSLGRDPVSVNGKPATEPVELYTGDTIAVHLEGRDRLFRFEGEDETIQINRTTDAAPGKKPLGESNMLAAAGTPKSAAKADKPARTPRSARRRAARPATGAPPPPPPPPPRALFKAAAKKPAAAPALPPLPPKPVAGAPLPAQLKDAITAGASNLRKVAGGANNQENWPAKPAVAAPSGAPAAAPFVPSATALQALRAGLRKTKQQAADEAAASAADAAPEPAQVPGKAPAVVSESAQAPVEAPIAAPKSAVKKPRPSRGAEGSYEQAKPVKKAKTVRFQMEEALASPEGVPQDITFTLEVDMAGSEVIQVDADSTMALSAWAMGTAADASAAIPGSAPKPRPTPKRKLSGGSLASGGRRRSTPRKASAAKMAEVEAEDRADAEKEAALDDQEMPAAATAADGSAPNGEDVTMAVAPMQLHFPASEGADEAEAADKTTDLSELAPSAGITVTAGPERDAGEQTTDLANIEIGPAAAALATAAAATPGPSAMPKNEDAADELSEEEEAESENEEAADDVTVELAPATGAKAPQCTPAAGFVPNSFFGAMEPSLLSIRLTEIAGAQTPGTAAALTPAGTLHIDVPRSVLARASASAAKSARARLSSVTKPGSPDAEAALEGALSALEELISAASAGRVAANCTDGAQLAPAVTASSESAGVVPGSAVARTPRAVARVAAQEITVAVPQGFLQSPAARQGFTLQISEDLVHGATPAQVAALERASEQDYTVEIPQHMFATPAPISACRQAAAQEADVDAEMAEDDAAMDQLVRETPTALMPGRPPLVAPIAMAQLDAADAALGAEASEVVPARELPVQELQAAELHAADQHAEAMVVNTDSAAAATPAGQQVLAAAKLLKRANLRARAAYTKAKVLEVELRRMTQKATKLKRNNDALRQMLAKEQTRRTTQAVPDSSEAVPAAVLTVPAAAAAAVNPASKVVVVRPASAPAAAAVRRTFQQAGAVVVLRPSPRAVRLPAEEVVPAGTPRSVAMSATAASSTKARRSSPRILLVSRSIPRRASVSNRKSINASATPLSRFSLAAAAATSGTPAASATKPAAQTIVPAYIELNMQPAVGETTQCEIDRTGAAAEQPTAPEEPAAVASAPASTDGEAGELTAVPAVTEDAAVTGAVAAVNAAVDTSMGEADAPPAAGPEAGTGMPTGETAAAAPAEVDAEMAEAADLASGVPAAEALVEAAAEAVADATNPTAASPAAGLPAEQPDLQPATELAAEAASDPASAMAIDVEPVVAQSDSSPVTAQLASKSGDAKSAASGETITAQMAAQPDGPTAPVEAPLVGSPAAAGASNFETDPKQGSAAAAPAVAADGRNEEQQEETEMLVGEVHVAGGPMDGPGAECDNGHEQTAAECDNGGQQEEEGPMAGPGAECGTVHKQTAADCDNDAQQEEVWPAEVCYVCCAAEEGDVLLLCDSCDAACHLGCCAPPLKRVPKGDWFCRDCAAKNAARAEQEAAAKAEAARLAAEMAEAAKKAAADVEAAAPARKSSRRASMSPAVATGLAKPSTSNGSRRSSLAPSAAAAAEETAATTEEAESKPAAQKRGSRRASMAPAQKLPEAGPEAAEKPATRRGTKRGAGAAPAPDTGLVEDIKEPAAAAVEAPAEPAEEKPAKRASRRASVAATSQPAEAKAAKPATTGAKRTRRGQSPSERAQAAAMALGVLDPIMEGNEEEGEEPVPAAPAAPAVKGRATRAKAVAAAAPAEEDDAAPAKRTRASASTPATEAPARKATRGSARARK